METNWSVLVSKDLKDQHQFFSFLHLLYLCCPLTVSTYIQAMRHTDELNYYPFFMFLTATVKVNPFFNVSHGFTDMVWLHVSSKINMAPLCRGALIQDIIVVLVWPKQEINY